MFCFPLENTFEVTLNRGQKGLGLSLSGGTTENRPIEVNDIYPNQPAAQSGRLQLGDVILAINGTPMYNRNVQVKGEAFLRTKILEKKVKTYLHLGCCVNYW